MLSLLISLFHHFTNSQWFYTNSQWIYTVLNSDLIYIRALKNNFPS